MMLTYRLVRVIETHSEELASSFVAKVHSSDQTTAYRDHVPPGDLRQRTFAVYQHLGQWLLSKSEEDVATYYRETGTLRARQGVPLCQLIWAIFLIKNTLVEFLERDSITEESAAILGELKLMQLLDQFFERAVYHATAAYESCREKARAAAGL